MAKLPPNPLVTEVFQKVSNAKTKNEKIAILLLSCRSTEILLSFIFSFGTLMRLLNLHCLTVKFLTPPMIIKLVKV
jgi:hypothetical protein